jgi:hypothetical protein
MRVRDGAYVLLALCACDHKPPSSPPQPSTERSEANLDAGAGTRASHDPYDATAATSPDAAPSPLAASGILASAALRGLSSIPPEKRWRIPREALPVVSPEAEGRIRVPVMPVCPRYRCSERVLCRDYLVTEVCPASIPGVAFPSTLDVLGTGRAWTKNPRACCFIEKYDCRDVRPQDCANL